MAAEGFLDTVVVTLVMRSGALVCINNSWRSIYGYDQRVEVHDLGGMLQLGNVPPTTAMWSNSVGVIGKNPLAFFLERYAEAYRREPDHFIDSLCEGHTL